jgi:DNA-binding CsgD family transcriptional regulator
VVIGREAERARIDALLEAGRRGRTGGLVVSGEPGIGKTALLEDAVARAAGMRVLRLTAVESESTLPFAGLHALLRPLVELLPRLEEPQEQALRIALALTTGDQPDVLAVNAGTLGLLAEAAAERPVLVAIDDAQWLDAPSADALVFAARRLEGEELVFVVAIRADESSAFDRAFERLELGPLARGDAQALLSRRREPVPPSGVERLLELAEGNPLALLELPAGLAEDTPDEVTAPDRVRKAFAARLDTLPAESRRALALAAAEPDPAAVRIAAETLELGGAALAPAEAAGLVRLDADGVVFRHPLVRSLAYSAVDPALRRDAHRALAEALRDDADRDRRAWHLAAAATEPDEELARLLEETADRAEARGGHAAAARALERAARLSRDRAAIARRLTRSARLAFWAGDADRALRAAEEAAEVAPDQQARTNALLEIVSVREAQTSSHSDPILDALAHIEGLAADESVRVLLLVINQRSAALDARGAVDLVPRIVDSARQADSWWKPRGLTVAACAHLAAGDPAGFERFLAEAADDEGAVANHALDLVWAERYDLARRTLETTLREARLSGNRMRIIWNQMCFAHLELRVGRLGAATTAAAEAITLADAHGMRNWAGIGRSALAGVHAWRGDTDACRTVADEALAAARESYVLPDELAAHGALGLLAVGLGRYEEAVDELAPLHRLWAGSTHIEPSSAAFVPDLVEAHAHLGEVEEARRVLESFSGPAERTRRQWALAAVARAEGILAGANAFAEAFERSLALLDSSPLTLDRARTQLSYGERLRRGGRRREARTHLRAAHEAFAAVDAVPWAERAAAELRATGATVGPRTPDRRAELTPQELQIADLVGEGKTNKEIASQLYLSPKTIEYHLANAYRKLGVHSRVELTVAMNERTFPSDTPG